VPGKVAVIHFLLESGNLAQNIYLVATALDLGCFNAGGSYDRAVDDYLTIDGLTHSTIYMIAIGAKST
jgi:nitroreductase